MIISPKKQTEKVGLVAGPDVIIAPVESPNCDCEPIRFSSLDFPFSQLRAEIERMSEVNVN